MTVYWKAPLQNLYNEIKLGSTPLMTMYANRRSFIAGLGAVAAVSSLPSLAAPSRLPGIRFGYAAITWGNEERQSID